MWGEGFPKLVVELARRDRVLPRHVQREFRAYLGCGDPAHLVDKVLPRTATRHFVLTVPWKRRWLLARRSDLADGVLLSPPPNSRLILSTSA